MNRGRHFCLKIGLEAGFVVCVFGTVAAGQGFGPDSKALADFERRIERSELGAVDRALMDFAIANPRNSKALELLARLRLRQGRLSESLALYRRVLLLDPGSAAARINSSKNIPCIRSKG